MVCDAVWTGKPCLSLADSCGRAATCGSVLSLNLCSVIWKQLVQQASDATDLAGFDEMVMQSLTKIEHIEDEGVDAELFADLIFESFTAQLSNGHEVEVCEEGPHSSNL